MNYNKVTLGGNLTRDPEMKTLPSGTNVCEFGLAINRTWTDRNTGEKREQTTFVDCKAMNRTAEVIHQWFAKGRPIFVEGRLDYRTWEKDGQKRSKIDVFVESFQFVGGRDDDGGGQPRQQRQAQPQQSGGGQSYGGAGANFPDDEVPF